MTREAAAALVAGGIVLLVLVAAGIGLAGTTRTETASGGGIQVPEPQADGSAGQVFDLREYGGLSLLGVQLMSPTREAHVGMVVPHECVSQDGAGGEVLLDAGVCADLPARGEVSGGGTTAAGSRLVFVRVEVPKPCFEALSIGERWPSGAAECAAD